MKLKHVSRFSASVAVLLGLWGTSFGCLEDQPTPDGVGGNATGGTSAGTSGSGGGGTGGMMTAMGGSAGAGMGGTMAADPATPLLEGQCGGIRNNMPCPLIGTCSDRPCGIADLGQRDCVCGATNAWSCTSCAFDMTDLPSVLIPPGTGPGDAGDAGEDAGDGALRSCEMGVSDNALCDPVGDRCLSVTGELCVCWVQNDDMQYIWDCDAIPSFWP